MIVESANLIVDYRVSRGMSREVVLCEAGLSEEDFASGAEMPHVTLERLWMQAVDDSNSESMGLQLAQFAQRGSLGLVEYVGNTAESFLEGTRRLGQYSHLLNDRLSITVEDHGGEVDIVIAVGEGMPRKQEFVDFSMASILGAGRHFAGGNAGLLALHLVRPSKTRGGDHERFYRAPVHFGEAHNKLVIDGPTARAALPSADPLLHAILRRQADKEVESQPPLDASEAELFLARARESMRATLTIAAGGSASVARRLDISERTLRRKLAALGTSHSALLEEVRRDLALKLEERGGLPQIEVATRVGYRSAAAYRRAFRAWTGMSPENWARR